MNQDLRLRVHINNQIPMSFSLTDSSFVSRQKKKKDLKNRHFLFCFKESVFAQHQTINYKHNFILRSKFKKHSAEISFCWRRNEKTNEKKRDCRMILWIRAVIS